MSTLVNEEDNAECQEFLSTIGNFPKLSKLLKSLNGEEEPKIVCRPCTTIGPEANARAALFDTKPIEIVLCTNRLKSEDFKEALTHELVHAYDYLNKKCDFQSCEGLAYTEIRAAREAECDKYFPFDFLKERCIRDHAKASTANLHSDNANQCVNKVYEKAVRDLQPWSSSKK